MRLTQTQINQVVTIVTTLVSNQAKIFLFGSRLDDSKKGGDVDLLVEAPEPIPLLVKAKIKLELEKLLYLPFDILDYCSKEEKTPFQSIAFSSAVQLNN